jgi:hypothetical protein
MACRLCTLENEPVELTQQTPIAQAAARYLAGGWSVLPLRHGGSAPSWPITMAHNFNKLAKMA